MGLADIRRGGPDSRVLSTAPRTQGRHGRRAGEGIWKGRCSLVACFFSGLGRDEARGAL